jgi:hypothetical protein
VLEKNGFLCEGCLKQHHECMGVVHDVMVYGLLKDQYEGHGKKIDSIERAPDGNTDRAANCRAH